MRANLNVQLLNLGEAKKANFGLLVIFYLCLYCSFQYSIYIFHLHISFLLILSFFWSILVQLYLKNPFFDMKQVKCRYSKPKIYRKLHKVSILPILSTFKQSLCLVITVKIVQKGHQAKKYVGNNLVLKSKLFVKIVFIFLDSY